MAEKKGRPQLTYVPSPKHCEPITAEKPGLKCPGWSAAIAQELLDESEERGNVRIATRDGVAFIAHSDAEGRVWHGYPEAWDKIDLSVKLRWKREGKVRSRQIRQFRTRADLRDTFGGSLHDL